MRCYCYAFDFEALRSNLIVSIMRRTMDAMDNMLKAAVIYYVPMAIDGGHETAVSRNRCGLEHDAGQRKIVFVDWAWPVLILRYGMHSGMN